MSTLTDADRFTQLMPFYVNGTLGAAERMWVDGYARTTPGAAQALHECRSLAAQVKAELRARLDAVPIDIGLAGLLLRVRDEPVTRVAPASPTPIPMPRVRHTFGQRLRESFAAVWRNSLTPRAAVAFAVIAVQFGVIAQLVHVTQRGVTEGAAPSAIRSAAPGGAAVATFTGPYLRVIFRDGATEQQVRALLLDTQLQLVAGPNQFGEYWLGSARDGLAVSGLLTRVQAHPLVASVVIDADLPPR